MIRRIHDGRFSVELGSRFAIVATLETARALLVTWEDDIIKEAKEMYESLQRKRDTTGTA